MTQMTPEDDIAGALGETGDKPLRDLRRILDHIGGERARQLVERAREIEAGDGMNTRDDSRKRTLGGIFFQLAREHVPRTPPPERKRRLRWHQAVEAAEEAAQTNASPSGQSADIQPAGEANTVKITLIGRPGRLVKRDTVVVTTMYNHRRPTLPKQLPKLSGADVETRYTVFIAAKQWRKVEEAMRNKEDALIIEGYCFLDPDVKGICVFAKSTTTKLIQRQRREAQRQKQGR